MGAGRYLRLMFALARFSVARELAFRGNFLVRLTVEVLWLVLLLAFYWTVFTKTSVVASWSGEQYLFFVGCFFALAGTVETLFLDGCSEFADLVRSGDLDFYLVRPIDEQFLITCRKIDWATSANVFMGAAVMVFALMRMPDWTPHAGQVLCFVLMFVCGVALAYSFLLLLTSTSIWFVRNQNLMEMWWLFNSLMRYPKEVYESTLPVARGWVLSFLVPVLLVTNVPAQVMVKSLNNPWVPVLTLLMAVLLLAGSRAFFLYSLRRYRSASS